MAAQCSETRSRVAAVGWPLACRRTPRLHGQKKSELLDEVQEEESSLWLFSSLLLDSTTNDAGEMVCIDREGIVDGENFLFCRK